MSIAGWALSTVVVSLFGAMFFALWKIMCVDSSPLQPGICECGHPRCTHERGKFVCTVNFMDEDTKCKCACRVFISAESAASDVAELERMYRKR